MKDFFYHFLSAIAALSAFATLIGWITTFDSALMMIAIVVVIIVISIGYAFYQTRPKKKIQIEVHAALRLNIFEGDLFDQEGIIVIPVNEYFDTIVDDRIIAHKTVHGYFIDSYYKNGRLQELDEKLELALQGVQCIDKQQRGLAKSKKYPLGTCAVFKEGKNDYVFWAFTHFDNNNHVYVTTEEIDSALGGLMRTLECVSNNRPVFMPLFGTGQSGVRKRAQQILSFIISTIEFSYPLSIPAGLNIVIKDLSKLGVNLNDLERMWKYYCK